MIEDHYRAIIESADDPIFICDQGGRFLYGNARAAANFGLTPQEFTGRTVYELFAPDVAEVFARNVRTVIATGEPSKSEDHFFIHGVEFWSSTLLQPLRDADGRVTSVYGIVRDITSRKHAEVGLRVSEERLRQVLRVSNIGIYELDFVQKTVYWSPQHRAMWGWGPDEPVPFDDVLKLVHPDDVERVNAAIALVQQSEDGMFEIEHRILRRDGTTRWLVNRGQNFFEGEGPARRTVRAIGAVRDVTDERLAAIEKADMQAQLVQAQKLESIGRLAGGIAHDFNNILNIIIGCAEMAISEPDASVVSGYLDEILKAATRSADLTKQLLGFARRQTVMPRVVDLNEFIAGSLKMLRRVIGEHVTLSWLPGHGLWQVRVDPGQIDQILVNLMANARDAIADVGAVVVHTENVVVTADSPVAGLAPGEYVMLGLEDNGQGMDDETQRHLFEPFYTTKPIGKGSGLGMASVDGIVRQNGGTITVESRLNYGTTVNVYLPRAHVPAALDVAGNREPAKRGTETVLVVEDEPALLRLTTRSLELLGYTVLAASTPQSAIELARAHTGSLDVLLTDVVLPGMNGRSLAERLCTDVPGLKCLFVSGYPAGAMGRDDVIDEDVNFLQKPFSPKALAEKVREVLESRKP